MEKIRLGFAMTGSFCTFKPVMAVLDQMAGEEKWDIYPIMSRNAYTIDSRFGKAEDFARHLEEKCGRPVIHSIEEAEPIGPQKLLDVLLVAPCTGNTLGKIANGVNDTPVTMAVKSHLRNNRPVVLAVSTNDALAGCAKNIGQLMAMRNIYFVPMAQDAPQGKPRSMVADFASITKAVEQALEGRQIQPILMEKK